MGNATNDEALPAGEVTQLFGAAAAGDPDAENRHFDLIYGELRRMAGRQELPSSSHTLSPTSLVHEAYIKMKRVSSVPNRNALFALYAQAMKWIIFSHARQRKAGKRTPPGSRVFLDDLVDQIEAQGVNPLDLDAAIDALRAQKPVTAQVFEYWFFIERRTDRIAEALGLPVSDVEAHRKDALAIMKTYLSAYRS